MTSPQDPNNHGRGQQPLPPPEGGYTSRSPKKSDTGMVLGVVAAVVLILVTLGLVGFVSPGFFLGDDKENPGAPAAPVENDTAVAPSPQALVRRIADEITKKNAAGLTKLACADAEISVEDTIGNLADVDSAEPTGELDLLNEAAAEDALSVQVDGRTHQVTIAMIKENDGWCLHELHRVTDQPEPPAQDARRIADKFIDKINAGDEAGAQKLACYHLELGVYLAKKPRVAIGDMTGNNDNDRGLRPERFDRHCAESHRFGPVDHRQGRHHLVREHVPLRLTHTQRSMPALPGR